MPRILVAYVTKNNQTKKIAEVIVEQLEIMGHKATAKDISKFEVELRDFDAVIVGAPVYVGQYTRIFRKWILRHADELSRKPTAFFSVCLGILQKDEAVQLQERKFVEDFFRECNWYPQFWAIFAGSLKYTKYNWFLRFIMKKISRRAGSYTESSHDYEFTDWLSVEKFTCEFANKIPSFNSRRDWPPVEMTFH